VRPYGTFSHPNVFGAFMFFSAIISLYLYYVSRRTWVRRALSVVLFFQIFAGVISFSRVAIVAFLVSALVWFILTRFMLNSTSQKGEVAGSLDSVAKGDSLSDRLQAWISKMKQRAVRSITSRIFAALQFSRQTIGITGGKNTVIDQIDPAGIDKKASLKSLLIAVIASLIIVGILFYPQFLERGVPISAGPNADIGNETNQRAISDRLLYQQIAAQMIKEKPLLGVGYKNFVRVMDDYSEVELAPYQHQPVHNIYSLVAAETGIIGLIVFLMFIGSILYKAWKSSLTSASITLLSIFIGFLFIGFFDHYLLTIQQGSLMFFLVSGLLVGSLE